MAAGAGCDPTAEGGELEALREMPERQSFGFERRLQRRSEDAGLDACGPRGAVDLEDPVETTQVDRDRSAIAVAHASLDPAADARAAAVGNGGDLRVAAPVEQRRHLLLAGREGNEVGGILEVAARPAHDVAIRLSVGVCGALVGVGAADPGERRRRFHPRRAQAHVFEARLGGDLQVVDAEALSSHAATELADDLPFALLLALDRLPPLERAAFLLHDVFDAPYASVASALGRSEDACRKLASRARLAIKRHGPVPSAPDDEHARLLAAFVEAAKSGDVSRIECLLTEDAVALSDGGGRVLAALHPIRGADRVARFISGVVRKQIEAGVTLRVENASINGRPGLLLWADDQLVQAVAIDVDDERIATLYMVLNPDKLAALSG